MEIHFASRKLQRLCEDEQRALRDLGPSSGKKLMQRLFELSACDSLADMGSFPAARLHPLSGDRGGQYSVDLHGGARLVFLPDHDPVPRRADGGIDLESVTEIEIVHVGDYHE